MFRYEKRKLSFQLVPSTAWYKNLRSLLPNWSAISVYVRNSGACAICGTKTAELDAHEVWDYNDKNYTQRLADIIPVCKCCHQTMHIGLAELEGHAEDAMEHYMAVNGLSRKMMWKDIDKAFEVFRKRSEHPWHIDLKQVYRKVYEITGIKCDFSSPVNGRYYALVDYNEKEQAKSMGAKWDATRKMWYFTNNEARNSWINTQQAQRTEVMNG